MYLRTERRYVNQGELLSEKSSDQEYLSAPLGPNTLILYIEIQLTMLDHWIDYSIDNIDIYLS